MRAFDMIKFPLAQPEPRHICNGNWIRVAGVMGKLRIKTSKQRQSKKKG